MPEASRTNALCYQRSLLGVETLAHSPANKLSPSLDQPHQPFLPPLSTFKKTVRVTLPS